MSDKKIVLEFTEDIRCPKCMNGGSEGDEFRPHFCSDSKCAGPRVPHIHLECVKCEFDGWFMLAANDDIENEFDDLDKFIEKCPMCHYEKIDSKYCSGESHVRKCKVSELKLDVSREHLSNECTFCGFEWVSDVKDYDPAKTQQAQSA
jgi:hypothetical protein